MKGFTDIQWEKYVEALNKADWFLRKCNEEQLNYHTALIERDIKLKY